MSLEDVIPVVFAGAKAFEAGVESNHFFGHVVTGRVGIEAAIDLITLTDEGGEPARVWPGSGCRDAEMTSMERKTTDGVDGGFTQHDRRGARSAHREVAEVFLGTGRHAAPACRCGAAKLGADRRVFFSKQ